MDRLVLHEFAQSGNCYKIRLTAAHLDIMLERREYDITRGETRTPDYLARVNVNGRIPVLQIDDRFLPESNAACCYLAAASRLTPADRFDHADMLRWLFWEQYNHEPNIATVRFWTQHTGIDRVDAAQQAALPGKRAAGAAALTLMDDHLARHDWLAGGAFSVADIVLYAYTHVAEDAGFALADYPAVARWLVRVAAQPGHIALSD